MKKTIGLIFLVVMAGAIFCFVNQKLGETEILAKLPEPEPVIVSSPQVPLPQKAEAGSDILSDIRKAQRLLETKEAGFLIQEKTAKGKKSKKWEVKDFSVLLAVQHPDNRIKIISVDPKAKKSEPPEYIIDWSRPNGVNTDFTIIQPQGCVVLAIKRVVNDEEGDLFKEAVYTPYSSSIDCETLRDAGLDYLKKIIEKARTELKNVASRSNPEIALVLAIIEHIDPGRLKRGEKIEQLINEVLVIIGANQGMAYRYSVSKANARGLLQFIPRTYAMIRDQYPDAKLEKNFVEGMNDHINAAKATLLLLDSDSNYLSQRLNLQKDKMSQGKYLASAYNCGGERTAKAIKSKKGFWEQKIPSETQMYLQKFVATLKIIGGT